jgi:hypothetical protein
MRRVSVTVLAVSAALASGIAPTMSAAAAEPGISVTFLPSRPTVIGRTTAMPIRVANTWPGTAVGVTLVLQAPGWVKLSGPGCVRRGSALRCALRDLAAGTAVTVRLQVMPTRLGGYRLVAEASAKTVVATPAAPAAAFGSPLQHAGASGR